MKNSGAKSYSMLIGSMLIFGTIGIFRRYIPLPSATLACIRGFIGALFLLPFSFISRRKKGAVATTRRDMLMLVLTGGLIGLNWILLFEAYNYTTVATATLCYYMEPTIVILLSPVFLREKLSAKKLVCAAAAVIGMIFVSGMAEGEGVSASDIKGILFGLGAAALYSAVVILNKRITVADSYIQTTVQLAAAGVILLPYLIISGQTSLELSPVAAIMVLVVGVVHTGLAYALYFGSIGRLKGQSVAVLSYLDPVSAMILSALFLDERMSAFGILGAVLIIGSALISELSFESRINEKTDRQFWEHL